MATTPVPDDGLLVEVGLTEKEYLAALKRMEAGTTRAANRNEKAFKDANSRVVKGFRGVNDAAGQAANGGLRMASMQLSQVAQQGAATGNYLQALAIQAPDLALGFGAVGIAAGALIPILYGVASAAFGAEEAVENIDVQGAYSAATGAIDEAREAQDRYTAAIRLSGVAQSEITPQVLASLKLEAQAREALAALEVERLNRQRRELVSNLNANRAALDEMLALANQGLESDNNAPYAYTEIERERLRQTQEILAANEDLVATIREEQAELDLVNALISQGNGEAAKMVDELLNAATAAGDTASAAGGIGGALEGGVAAALRLAEALGISLELARSLAVTRANLQDSKTYSGRGGDPRDFMDGGSGSAGNYSAGMDYKPVSEIIEGMTPKLSSKGGGRKSGGGGMSDAQREAERETNRLLGERDRILRSLETPMEEYERKLADLNEIYRTGELNSTQYTQALEVLQDELANAEYGAVIEAVESISDAMADAIVESDNLGEAFSALMKRMAADMISSGLQSMLTGGGKPGGGIIASLANALPWGGARASGGTVQAGRAYMTGENGPEPFVPAVNGRILSTQQAQQALSGGNSRQKVDVDVRLDVPQGVTVDEVRRVAGDVSVNVVRRDGPGVVHGVLRSSANQGITRNIRKR